MSMKKFICLILIISTLLLATGCYSSNPDGSKEITLPATAKTIRFDTNGGTSVSPMTVFTLNRAPKTTKSDSVSMGWYLDETLTIPAVFPLDVDKNMTIYAKWLKTHEVMECTDCKIKWGTGYSSALIYDLTPNGFDLQELSKLGYTVEILVTYSVRYKKDYDVLLDIGYAGAPKYEIYLLDAKGVGTIKENLTTTTSNKTRIIELTRPASSLIGDKITLKVSTDNIQNIIYFTNITVVYNCYK